MVNCCCLFTKSCPTLLQSHRLQTARLFCSQDFPGKNTGVGCHYLLQWIFLTQGSNLCLLHWQADSLPLSLQGSPQMVNSLLKRCSSQLTREMQIKTTMKCHLTPVRMAIIKKSINDKHQRECREKGTLIYCWQVCKLVKLLWKTV